MSVAAVGLRKPIAERLRGRREEIEQALLARIYGIEDPEKAGDLTYDNGIRAATSGALELAFATLEDLRGPPPSIPPAVLVQARLAARDGVGLDTVMRRYTAGHGVLGDLIVEEAEADPSASSKDLRACLAAGATALDRVLAAVGEEYFRAAAECASLSPAKHGLEPVERLLAGEPIDTRELPYDFGGWHHGVALSGSRARGQLLRLAQMVDRRLLVVEPLPGDFWAWLGGPERLQTQLLADRARECLEDVTFAIGEAARGIAGWRLTHQQARAVLPFAAQSPDKTTCYKDNALLACVSKDPVLVRSLQALFLDPLADDPHEAETLCETLRAYFDASCNISSAASALSVHRQTVSGRLNVIEQRLARPVAQCAAELNVALRLDLYVKSQSPEARCT